MRRFLFVCSSILFLRAEAQTYYPPSGSSHWDTLSPSSLGWCPSAIDSLYSFLDSSNTKAFILLKNGRIVLEKYFNGHGPNDQWYWASAGKGLTAFLIGQAQEDQLLDINDSSSQYLGQGWTSCSPTQEGAITIRDQLRMTTGLDDAVTDVDCTLDSCLQFEANAGTRWAYHNAPYTLLLAVLEAASGQGANNFAQQSLLSATGMQGAYIPLGFNRVFFSTARSMARFGLLVSSQGRWNAQPLLADTVYLRQMVTPSQNLNNAYGYLWWLNGQTSFMLPHSQIQFNGPICPQAPEDMYAAIGRNAQIINVVPSEEWVWIRMGDAPDSSAISIQYNDAIWGYLNALNCQGISADEEVGGPGMDIQFQNPVVDKLHIAFSPGILPAELRILNIHGQSLLNKRVEFNPVSVDVQHLSRGLYWLQIEVDHQLISRRLLID